MHAGLRGEPARVRGGCIPDASSLRRRCRSPPGRSTTAAAAAAMQTGPAFARLNDAVIQLLDDFSMVTFTPLDVSEEESIEDLLLQVDMAIQVRRWCRRRWCRRWRRERPAAAEGARRHCEAASLGSPGPALSASHPPCCSCPALQYGEDQEVKAQELGDMADPVEPDD